MFKTFSLKTISTLMFISAITAGTASAEMLFADKIEEIIAKTPNLTILDMQHPDNYKEAHLEGAKNMQMNDFFPFLNTVTPDMHILVYGSFMTGDNQAAYHMLNSKTANRYYLKGGFDKWHKSKRKFIHHGHKSSDRCPRSSTGYESCFGVLQKDMDKRTKELADYLDEHRDELVEKRRQELQHRR